MNFATKAACGMVAGGIGAFIGTPAEISLIRMTSDGRLNLYRQTGELSPTVKKCYAIEGTLNMNTSRNKQTHCWQ